LKIENPGLLIRGAEAGTVEEQSKEVIKKLLFSSDEGSIANDEKKKTERDWAKRSYDAEIRSLLSSDYSCPMEQDVTEDELLEGSYDEEDRAPEDDEERYKKTD
jgi:hypothetical protein